MNAIQVAAIWLVRSAGSFGERYPPPLWGNYNDQTDAQMSERLTSLGTMGAQWRSS